ncbi:helix-turn-helix domain-containing protein [Pseudomonas plecoglossicida]|uniref:helix-turn-helix domain-containing protein n=1 Tax=Pseudomonas plecoglossicida TaxID=70775 RepID=UPI0015E45F0F|nr:helix-turn-helix domain-containing protein [Pseudomonas plecoglossicida]MBA1324598.1 bacteriophage CI repressor [Pseudomonas plecoglossicida]
MSNTSLVSVLIRLKHVTGTSSDSALAKVLDVSPQTLSSWKVRESIPYAFCIAVAQRHNVSLDWLLLGIGSPSRTAPAATPPAAGDLLELVQGLAPDDLQAIRIQVLDKLRLQELERRLDELTRPAASA